MKNHVKMRVGDFGCFLKYLSKKQSKSDYFSKGWWWCGRIAPRPPQCMGMHLPAGI